MKSIYIATVLIVLVGGATADSMPNRPQPNPPSNLQLRHPMNTSSTGFTILDFGHTPLHEGFQPQPKVLVFQDQTAWTQFWNTSKRLDMNLQKPAAPQVDFSAQTILGVTSGSHRTGGYGLAVDQVEKVSDSRGGSAGETGGDRWVIHYRELAPDAHCLVTQEPTTPVVFISMPKSMLPVELQGNRVTQACGQ